MTPFNVLAGLLAFVYLFNLPFGYWRAATKKLTKEWVLAVHLPVPVIFALRVVYGVGLELIPLFVFALFLGQFSGGRIRRVLVNARRLAKCPMMDLIRIASRRI